MSTNRQLIRPAVAIAFCLLVLSTRARAQDCAAPCVETTTTITYSNGIVDAYSTFITDVNTAGDYTLCADSEIFEAYGSGLSNWQKVAVTFPGGPDCEEGALEIDFPLNYYTPRPGYEYFP